MHIHDTHGPSPAQTYSRPKLYSFALVVCQRPSDSKFLLVQEFGSEGYLCLSCKSVENDKYLLLLLIVTSYPVGLWMIVNM